MSPLTHVAQGQQPLVKEEEHAYVDDSHVVNTTHVPDVPHTRAPRNMKNMPNVTRAMPISGEPRDHASTAIQHEGSD